jgi:ABC-type sugar transport system ATPase subunit
MLLVTNKAQRNEVGISEMSNRKVTVENLVENYPGDGVSFSVDAGQILGFLGTKG